MGVPISEAGYTIATTRREDHEVHKNRWWHWGGEYIYIYISLLYMFWASKCTSSRENYCMGGVWSAGWIESNQPTRHHPYRVTNTTVAQIQ